MDWFPGIDINSAAIVAHSEGGNSSVEVKASAVVDRDLHWYYLLKANL